MNGCETKQSLKFLINLLPSTVGVRFDASMVDEELLRAYREKQKINIIYYTKKNNVRFRIFEVKQ